MLFVKLHFRLLLICAVIVSLHTGAIVVKAQEYGVGAEDYIVVDDGLQDLLSEEQDWDDEQQYVGIYDPLEPWNRIVFEFNDRLYFWVLKPVKEGYSAVVPTDIRICIGNFFFNLGAPVRLVNNILQGRGEDAGVVLSRFLINSTLGVYGFGDVAAEEFDLEPQRADFGQTLGVYGVRGGIYICWPLLGPSNVRDTVGLVADYYAAPLQYTDLDTTGQIALRGVEFINRMSILPDVYEEMKRISLDPYVATREAYTDYRRGLIRVKRFVDDNE